MTSKRSPAVDTWVSFPRIAVGLLVATALLGRAGGPALAATRWTLERAVARALRDNPDARLSAERIAVARAGLERANAAFWPQVSLATSYVGTNNPVMVFGARLNQKAFDPQADLADPNSVPTVDNLNVKGTVNVPLFVGGSNLAGRAAATARGRAVRHQAEAVRNELAFEVARAFLTVQKAKAFERAAVAAVEAFERNLAIAQKRFSAGTLLRADVLDVEVRLARAREDLVRSRNAHVLSLHVLRNLIGIEHGTIDVSEEVTDLATPATGDSSDRAELRAMAELLRAAEAGVRQAKAGYWPRLDAFASLAYDAGLELDGDNLSYVAGVQMQWQVWDGFATRSRVSATRTGLATLREQRRKLRLALDLELAQARIQLKESTERLAVTEKIVAQAKESVELTRARFQQGLALATQLIDAETALTAARMRRAESEADRRIAVAALRKALGLSQVPNPNSDPKDGAR